MMQAVTHLHTILNDGLQKGLSAATASACDAVTLELATCTTDVSGASLEDAGKQVELLIKCSLTSQLLERLEMLNASPNSAAAAADGSQQKEGACVSLVQLHSGVVRYAAAVVTRSSGLHEGVCFMHVK